MSLEQLKTLNDINHFLEGTQAVAFLVSSDKRTRYLWVQKTLVKHQYIILSRADKGLVTRFIMKVTNYSHAQTKRLIRLYVNTGKVTQKPHHRNGFERIYTDQDIRLLAKMDELHNQPSGGVLKKLCERAYKNFDQQQYRHLANISVSHLYNLRQTKTYERQRYTLTKTKPQKAPIGYRRKPASNNQPGYIRIDSVHQGDQGMRKGVYHINAVDEVTQFEVIITVGRISEDFMLPALKKILNAFPFKIRGFHSDNGTEYINYGVAKLLETLRVDFTKSRPRRSNDNGLVESKNGSVVRKLYGYIHVPERFAKQFNALNFDEVYRYVNFHRPCYFPTTTVDKKGKEKKKYHYKDMKTPFEKLRSLNKPSQYLKSGVTLKKLAAFAGEMTDNEAAEHMSSARNKLFNHINERLREGI